MKIALANDHTSILSRNFWFLSVMVYDFFTNQPRRTAIANETRTFLVIIHGKLIFGVILWLWILISMLSVFCSLDSVVFGKSVCVKMFNSKNDQRRSKNQLAKQLLSCWRQTKCESNHILWHVNNIEAANTPFSVN